MNTKSDMAASNKIIDSIKYFTFTILKDAILLAIGFAFVAQNIFDLPEK